MTQLIPYLFYNGQCREAMQFYQSVFGGELSIMNADDAPGGQMPDGMAGRVMHACLTGSQVTIMASDTPDASDQTRKVELLVTGEDEPGLRAIFDGLAEGGTVKSPLKAEFWGDIFGTLTDRFGVDWMVSIKQAG